MKITKRALLFLVIILLVVAGVQLAVEDRRFYKHNGFDIKGTASAFGTSRSPRRPAKKDFIIR